MKYLKKIIFYINKKISLIIIILVFAVVSKFFTNIYNLYYRDYSERMNIHYGYCNKESYGYVKKIKDIYIKGYFNYEKSKKIVNSTKSVYQSLVLKKISNHILYKKKYDYLHKNYFKTYKILNLIKNKSIT